MVSGLTTLAWFGVVALKAAVSGVMVWSYAESNGNADMLVEGVRSIPDLLVGLLPTPGGGGE